MVEATALLPQKSVLEMIAGQQLRHSSGGHSLMGEKKIIFLLTATPRVRGGQVPCVLQH